MTRSWVWWAILSATGVGIVLLLDAGPRLSLSQEHGPSLVDGIGILLLVAGWATLDVATWRRRSALDLRPRLLVLTVVAGASAAGLVLWSVLGDHGAWWIAGASVLAAIQLLAGASVSRGGDGV